MDFTLTTEQAQLSDTLGRWTQREYGFELRREIVGSSEGTSAQAWAGLRDLGVLALPVPEALEGLGASGADMLVVMEALGKALLVEPYMATVCGIEFLRHDRDRFADLMAQTASGAVRLACALGEKQSRFDRFDVAMTARPEGGDHVLNGRKTVVVHGAQADHLIVSARIAGDTRDCEGISLFLIPAGAEGLSRTDYRTIDGMRAADIDLVDVRVPDTARIGTAGEAWPIIDAVSDYACALLCAEAVGIMQAVNEMTLDYLKMRRQFDQPIGAFQALQHRMAEMFIEVEQARSMAMLAASVARSDETNKRRHAVSAAMIRVGQAARRVGQEAIQMHGGIGMTNETRVAHYFKRLAVFGALEGDIDHHVARLARQPEFHHAD